MVMQYDYIVVGAGAAGCIVAARLSEDPAVTVLLVEAGGSDRQLIIAMPAALPFVYQSKQLGWGYQSGPEPHLGGKTIDEKQGKVIGGSTSINAMICNRGNPMDYDGWAELGLADWDYAHCLPYFRKLETFADGADAWRGGDGPMQISRCRAEHKLYDAFLRGGEQAGFAVTPDHNGYQQEGLHIAQAFIHQGRRWSAARAYLDPTLARPNLRVLSHALVERVVIEHGAAVGIAVVERGSRRAITCAREVILCAGAINSPRLLMLSGVGDPDELRRHGIAVVFNHLATRQDVQDLIDGVRLARTLLRQPAWERYRGAELTPGAEVSSDRELEAFVRQRTGTSYHPACTCRMGADAEAVVDSEARVSAVERLRIVDASIMPRVITGNLNAPVMMMAEKLVDRIRGRPVLPPSAAPYYRAAGWKAARPPRATSLSPDSPRRAAEAAGYR